MITVLSLNPSVDHAIEVERFTEGGLNRVALSRKDAGGKGVNVALALAALGAPATVTGFLWRDNAAIFENRLTEAGVHQDFVMLDGAVRTNIKLKSRETGSITEINESGRDVSESDLMQVRDRALALAKESSCLILSGSVPPGTPAGFYGGIIREARKSCFTVLDADGEKLEKGVEALPHMIKPNRFELETLVGRSLPDLDDVKNAALELVKKGIEIVLVSLGGDGALLVTKSGCWRAEGLEIDVKSTVAAGDSMIAGFAAAVTNGWEMEDAFAVAVAASAAKCMTEGTAPLSPEAYAALYPKVQIRRIS